MLSIVADIASLLQHKNTLKTQPEIYVVRQCIYCGKLGAWCHGFRDRKSDRENIDKNPISILRMYCPHCHRTFSVLPECIPPRRWHLWETQQQALQLFLAGMSFLGISKKLNPSRWTISRWICQWKEAFSQQSMHLKSHDSSLGYCASFEKFWSTLLEKISLSKAMYQLWTVNCPIP